MCRRSRKGTHAQYNNEQEVDIGDVVELEPQVLRYEAERRVFGGSYLVAGVLCERVAFFVAFCLRQGDIEVDPPACVSLFGACI